MPQTDLAGLRSVRDMKLRIDNVFPAFYNRQTGGGCESPVCEHNSMEVIEVDVHFELADNVLTAEDFIRLKTAAGFMERPVEQVEKALGNGLLNVSALCDGKVVGMGRLVGDGAMYWYLQEIIVLPEYQGKGIGKSIVNRLLEHIEGCLLPGTGAEIGLTAVKGKEPFYERFGFETIRTGMKKWIEKS